MDALRSALVEIEGVLSEIRNTGKQDYLNKDHPNFSRIMHDYLLPKSDLLCGKVFWSKD